jgi:uncharacterized cupredoxin-like copper-binding protein
MATVLVPKEPTTVTANDPQTAIESPSPPGSHRSQHRRGWRDMRSTLLVAGALVVASIVAVAIAFAVRGSSAPAGDIQATTVNFKIEMPTTLTAGKHTIGFTNSGTVGHEIVLFKTDLAANDLPLKADGDVNEESPQLTSVGDSGDALKAGATQSFKTENLSPGHYVAVCNLPGHYRSGMKLDITVR